MKSWLNRAAAVANDLKEQSSKLVADVKAGDTQKHVDTVGDLLRTASDQVQSGTTRAVTVLSEYDYKENMHAAYRDLSARSENVVAELRNKMTHFESDTALSEEEKLKKSIDSLSGKDRVGLFGEGMSAVIGGIGGVAASGAIASAAGASTILGSSALGSALGGVFVASTPVGWVVGSALVLGAAGYGAAKLVRSGSEQDKVRAELVSSLTARLNQMKEKEHSSSTDLDELNQITAICIAGGLVDESTVDRMVALVDAGDLDPQIAIKRLKAKALEAGLIELS